MPTNQYKEELIENFFLTFNNIDGPLKDVPGTEIKKMCDFWLQKIDEAVREERQRHEQDLQSLGNYLSEATSQMDELSERLDDRLLEIDSLTNKIGSLSTPTNKETK